MGNRLFDENELLGSKYKFNNTEYEINGILGTGGVGVVYKATNKSGNNLCLKFFNPRKGIDTTSILKERFYREARISQEFDNENFIKIFDVSKYNDRHHYCMEYCEGGDLKTVLRDNKSHHIISFKERWNIFIQLCEVLHYIHSRGYIHRDLKPDNILVVNKPVSNEQIKIKLSDYGSFYNIVDSGDNPITLPGDIIGSLIYISPEQRLKKELTKQTDIYSLGIILYQLLINDTIEYRLKPISTIPGINSECKRILQSTIYKMTETDLRFRYNDVNELLCDLKSKFSQIKYDGDVIFFPAWLKTQDSHNSQNYKTPNCYHEDTFNLQNFNEESWTFNSDYHGKKEDLFAYPTEAVVHNGTVFAGWTSGCITSISLSTGVLNWFNKVSENRILSAPICHNNNCYVIDCEGELFSIDIYDEKINWKVSTKHKCYYPLKIIKDHLFVISNDSVVLIFELPNGNILHEVEFRYSYSDVDTIDVISDNQNIFIMNEEEIIGLRNIQIEGKLSFNKWIYNNTYLSGFWDRKIFVGISYDNKNIYAATSNGAVVCIDSLNGEEIWKIETAERLGTAPFISGDLAIFITDRSYIYLCDKSTGATLRRIKYEESSWSRREPDRYCSRAISKGSLVAIIDEYEFSIFDINTMKTISGHEIGKEQLKIPTLSGNTIIISSTYGLQAFKCKDER